MKPAIPDRMQGAVLPGDSTTQLCDYAVASPGHGEVLLRIKASTICGSDIRCIYHEHLGKGPEGYQGVIAGHEPCGQVAAAGPAEDEGRPNRRKVREGVVVSGWAWWMCVGACTLDLATQAM